MDSSVDIDPLALPVETQLGSYRVVSPLGKGGMGSVYVVERDGRKFAAKLTKRKLSDLSEAERERTDARVRREISILWAVSHPNLVRIHAADRWPDMAGYLYLITDLVDGDPLTTWQAKTKPSLRKLVECFRSLAGGVQELHRAYFIHRDLKSENVIVDANGRPVIIDFGISRQRDSYTITSQTSIVGTSDHLSPEYCRYLIEVRGLKGEKYEYRPTDDLHAVGYMLYEALCGSPPFEFQEDSEWELLQDIAMRTPPSPKSINPAVPESLDAITMRLLEKLAEKRHQSGRELEEALRAALEKADATWDEPFTPPPYQSFRQRGTAGGSNARSVGGSVVSVGPVSSGDVAVPSADGKPPPPLPSGLSDTSVKREVVYAAAEAAPLKAAEPAPRFSTDAPARFVSIDAREAAPQETVRAASALPSALRDAVGAVGPTLKLGSRPKVVVLGVGAIALVLFVAFFLRSGAQQPKDLLKSFEQQRAEELARVPTVQPMAATPTGTPPAEQVRSGAAPNPTPASVSDQPRHPEQTSSNENHTHFVRRPKRSASAEVAKQVAPPADVPPPQRSLLRSSAMRGAAPSLNRTDAAFGVARGQMFQARLAVPVSPEALGPVTALVTSDVRVNGQVVIPRQSTVVGAAVSSSGGRINIRWDTLNVQGRGAVAIEALAYGADQLPGIPFHQSSSDSTGSTAKEAALATGEHLASRLLGDDLTGDLGRGAVDAAAESARGGSRADSAPVVIPKGPTLYVFVTKAF
jgi:serine/threonine protein kinase